PLRPQVVAVGDGVTRVGAGHHAQDRFVSARVVVTAKALACGHRQLPDGGVACRGRGGSRPPSVSFPRPRRRPAGPRRPRPRPAPPPPSPPAAGPARPAPARRSPRRRRTTP